MNKISNCESGSDLEKCVQPDEEGKIRLLEDTLAGKWIYFFSWYFFDKVWIYNSVFPLFGVFLGTGVRVLYFVVCEAFSDQAEATSSEILSPLWMVTHYLLYFTVCFVTFSYDRRNIEIGNEVFQNLLEDVSGMDLTDVAAWRKIAHNANCVFKQSGHRYAFFYSGEHCRCFFLTKIVKPVECGSCVIKTYWNHEACTDYCKDSSNKKLAERAVANYQKSIENFSEIPPLDERAICSGCLFKYFPDGVQWITVYLLALEFAAVFFLCLAVILSVFNFR